MSESNKRILQQANAAVTNGDNEGFLALCADDIVWQTIGGDTLHGKAAVRGFMAQEYVEPPEFSVHRMVSDGDHVIAIGEISSKGADGTKIANGYCDVWRVVDGKLAELAAYVVPLAG